MDHDARYHRIDMTIIPGEHQAPKKSNAVSDWGRQVVKIGAAAFDGMHALAPGVVVLIYHRVGQLTSGTVDLPMSLFEQQIAELAASGRVITLDEAIDRLTGIHVDPLGHDEFGAPPVVVTFDDGSADLADLATPVLDTYGVPASLYLVTDAVDNARAHSGGPAPLSWSALREMVSTSRWTIESHTHSHMLLDRLPEASISDQLDRSIDLISENIGRTPQHFAYPKALLGSPAAAQQIRERFRSAAIAGTRANRFEGTDPWALHRSPIQVDDGMKWFRRKALGGMRLEDDLRRAVNRVRHASRTS